MENIVEREELIELVKKNIKYSKEEIKLNTIGNRMYEILLGKSFKGNPLFILDLVENIIVLC